MSTRHLRISVPDPSWKSSLDDLGESIELVVWDTASRQPDGHLDLVLRPYDLDNSSLGALDVSRIGVLQSQALGFDGVAEALPAGGAYANAVGVHEESTAELAVALTLASQRRLDEYARSQPSGHQTRGWAPSLIDSTVVLLGHGGIGIEVEKRLTGFGATIVRIASTARKDGRGRIHGTDELGSLLPGADVVIVAVPLSDVTEGMIGDAFLAALPDGALVVNVSRGRVADTEALVRHTAAGRIRYATDVTEPEPLPAGHPLYTAPGVLIAPHVGGMSAAMRPRIERLVRHQIDLLLAGREPDHVVVRT